MVLSGTCSRRCSGTRVPGPSWDATRNGIEATVEEALRWETPIAVLPRMSASEPVEFYGVEIPADSWVLFAMAGANRDPAVFPDPDRFDIGRIAK